MRAIIACLALYMIAGSVSAQTLPPLSLPTAVPPTETSTAAPSSTLTQTPTSTATRTGTPTDTPTATVFRTPTVHPSVTLEPMLPEVRSEVLFPAGVAFEFRFRAPAAGIDSIAFSVVQDGWRGDAADIDLAAVQIGEDGHATLTYLWVVPANPPQPFLPLTFQWEFQPTALPVEIVTVETVLTDNRFSWDLLERPNDGVTVAVPQGSVSTAAVAGQIERIRELLAPVGRDVPSMRIALFDASRGGNSCTEAPELASTVLLDRLSCSISDADRIYDETGWVRLSAPRLSGTVAQDLVSDYVIRQVFAEAFETETTPEWFKAGTAQYFSSVGKSQALISVRDASRVNRLLPSLDTVPTDPVRGALWRDQSFGWVVYITDLVGRDGLLALLDVMSEGATLAEAWAEIADGRSIGSIGSGWRGWIFTAKADIAYSAPPFGPPTPTVRPSRTFTMTPTPTETLTPSATPTETPTPTPTLTYTATTASGFAPPTRAPSLTPSLTPTTTPTPRPAEVFDLTEEETPGISTTAVVVGGLVLAAVVLIAALTLILRRR